MATLSYAAVFDAGLTPQRLLAHLITARPLKKADLQPHLQQLRKAGRIKYQRGFYFLPQVKTNLRLRQQESSRKRELLRAQIHLIAWLPTLRAVAITGSVGAGNATPAQDIDLLLVTSPQSLWLTRLVVVLLVLLSGRLRLHDSHEVKDAWCLNMWLDTNSLALTRQSLYIAHEVVQAQWLVDKDDVEQQFLARNAWVKQYLANTNIPTIELKPTKPALFLSHLNAAALSLQRLYMLKRPTREVMTASKAFFHPRDTGKTVLRRYETIWRQTKRQK